MTQIPCLQGGRFEIHSPVSFPACFGLGDVRQEQPGLVRGSEILSFDCPRQTWWVTSLAYENGHQQPTWSGLPLPVVYLPSSAGFRSFSGVAYWLCDLCPISSCDPRFLGQDWLRLVPGITACTFYRGCVREMPKIWVICYIAILNHSW